MSLQFVVGGVQQHPGDVLRHGWQQVRDHVVFAMVGCPVELVDVGRPDCGPLEWGQRQEAVISQPRVRADGAPPSDQLAVLGSQSEARHAHPVSEIERLRPAPVGELADHIRLKLGEDIAPSRFNVHRSGG